MMNLPIFYDQLNFYRKLRPKIKKKVKQCNMIFVRQNISNNTYSKSTQFILEKNVLSGGTYLNITVTVPDTSTGITIAAFIRYRYLPVCTGTGYLVLPDTGYSAVYLKIFIHL